MSFLPPSRARLPASSGQQVVLQPQSCYPWQQDMTSEFDAMLGSDENPAGKLVVETKRRKGNKLL